MSEARSQEPGASSQKEEAEAKMSWPLHQQRNGTPNRAESAGRAILGCLASGLWLLASGSWLLLASGCGPTPAQRIADRAITDYFMGDYDRAEKGLQPLSTKTNEDFVLNNVRLGSVALANYDLDVAEAAFLRAYEVINSVGVNDGGRSIGAAVVDEKIKVWKGEPFERAMANFYLGLVYYMRHDYGNARAALENALFKLRDYGESKDKNDKYRESESNFTLAYLMLGRCYQRLDRPEDAQKAFARAVELRPDLQYAADPRLNEQTNLLLVVDYGHGPLKLTSDDGSLVGFGPTPREEGPIPTPLVTLDGQTLNLSATVRPPIDLLALAQDRKWQSIDTIRAIKSVLGTGLIVGGAAYGIADRHANPYVALGLIAGGIALKAMSQADVRQWEMLPRTVLLIPLQAPPGKHNISVQFPAVPGLMQTWYGLDVPPTGDATYYLRMQRYNPGPFTWPPPKMIPAATPTTDVVPVGKVLDEAADGYAFLGKIFGMSL
jgi:tetratricopeptide (TPR) repeat protein